MLETDASDRGVGAVLTQVDEEGRNILYSLLYFEPLTLEGKMCNRGKRVPCDLPGDWSILGVPSWDTIYCQN